LFDSPRNWEELNLVHFEYIYLRMALDGGVPGQDAVAGTAAARASRGSAFRSR